MTTDAGADFYAHKGAKGLTNRTLGPKDFPGTELLDRIRGGKRLLRRKRDDDGTDRKPVMWSEIAEAAESLDDDEVGELDRWTEKWDETQHPRDENGKFISKGNIKAAAKDEGKVKELVGRTGEKYLGGLRQELAKSGYKVSDAKWKALVKSRGKTATDGKQSAKAAASALVDAVRGDKGEITNMPKEMGKLRVPPAWTDVKVASDATGKVWIKARDAKGRVQTVYNPTFIAEQQAKKFERVRSLIEKMDKVEDKILSDARSGLPEARATYLIQSMGLRPGSSRNTKAEKQAYGAVTLLKDHVKVDGDSVRLQFTGKKGVPLDLPVNDPEAAAILKDALASAKGDRLFDTTAKDVLAYSKSVSGGFKSKDFRTAKGTTVAQKLVAGMKPPRTKKEFETFRKEVGKQVAEVLGNTPTVALAAYIDPRVFDSWQTTKK